MEENNETKSIIFVNSTAAKKLKFLAMFRETHGIIELAARAAGVARASYYNWRRDDAQFNKECIDILMEQEDYVEDIFLKQIHEGDPAAVRFYLANRHRKYKRQSRLPGGGMQNTEQPVTLEELLDSSDLTKIPNGTNDKPAADTKPAENSDEARPDSTI